MSAANSELPPGFETLEPYVASWALVGAPNRAHRRTHSTEQERADFYNAVQPLLVPALAYLDERPLNALDEKAQRLMTLLLGFAHAAQAVEVQGENEAVHAQQRGLLKISRAVADG
ncbi:hypothetical protein LJR225_002352 [Phenylobacterium sp. LjRoot225]|uniref:hypothetical protein n=1 Tax=Phenylobacterium sp. LjRoot225 TaxID=3342285 RepID=UPI003ECEFBDB